MRQGKDHYIRRENKAIRAAFYLYDDFNGIRKASKRRLRACNRARNQWRRGVYDYAYWWGR